MGLEWFQEEDRMHGVSEIMGYRRNWGQPEYPSLTCREIQVLRLVADGRKNHEIGECLGISVRTVKIHLANVYAKLGVNRRIEAAAILISQPGYLEARAS